jgi:hypothetical protein
MNNQSRNWDNLIWTTAVSAIGTTFAASMRGYIENREPIQPINAISHIVHGDKAAHKTRLSMKYTLTGLALNVAAVGSWSVMQEYLIGEKRPTFLQAATCGLATAATAYITDYYLVPKWLTPGFEKPLSRKGLAIVFGTLALSLALGSISRSRANQRPTRHHASRH